MFKTIKTKLIFTTLLLIIISVGVPSYFLMDQFKQNFEQRSAIMIKSTFDVVMRGIYDRMLTKDHGDVQSIVDEISMNPSVNHIRIIDENTKVLYASNRSEIGKTLEEINPNHLSHSPSDSMKFSRISDAGVWSAIQPINNNKECQQCHEKIKKFGYIDIDTKLTRAESYFYTGSLHIFFLASLIIIILFFMFYIVFNKYINSPLRNFIKTMEKIEQGDLNAKLPAVKNDEIGTLEKSFNHMIGKLRESQNRIEEMHFDQLRHADKLVTLGELAAEMAHEINNPAAIIMSRADYLQMESENNYQLENYKEDLDVILNQTERVSKITQNILKYSKKLPKNFEKIDLIQIINESIKILEPRIHKKKIISDTDFQLDQAYIFGDSGQMEQVITNLVNNAIDAMNEEGKLIIQVSDNMNNEIKLSFSDDGQGITPEIKDKIFSPFFTTKSGNKGTGLGLYIVKNICKNHNAEITCQSNGIKGTTFSISFKRMEN